MKILRGLKDFLPKKKKLYNKVIIFIKKIFCNFFFEIETPIIENFYFFKKNNLFNEEIYKFKDYSKKILCLRPENTTPCLRIFNLYKKKINLFYYGNMFRYEKPQKNKLRQFKQLGIEIFQNKILEEINILILINKILFFFKKYIFELNDFINFKNKFIYNKIILFFLNKKNIKTKKIFFKILDKNFFIKKFIYNYKFLNKNNNKKIKKILFLLKKNIIFNPKLVRGIEYYSNIIFEWKNKNSVCGGGGYNFYSYILLKKIKNSFGLSLGIDRLLIKKKMIKKKVFKIKTNFILNFFLYKLYFSNNFENIKILKINNFFLKIIYIKKKFFFPIKIIFNLLKIIIKNGY
ncbi:ATP phosphoribosyltransferase regulatory subunit [Candidatus Carsonella ruddii]|uniref:Histidine--tRNA ligase n=1 Tax=Candidatus Carsonella ruddii CE isolate Thao2000 TaxID=1202536 RepID=J7GW60_CARRU|nr:ATP phosphoribosyltransferase regulatory subunit [Candidatus Carsonella ruddii]AFP83656.1 histidyl-tRNA synthetase [Candidatus Carsonella ruddii CE isolate Thao2000]